MQDAAPPLPPGPRIDEAAIERACRAHWPRWDDMRPENQQIWRQRMERALRTFLSA